MLPTERGEAATWKAIRRYAWATAAFSLAVAPLGGVAGLIAAPLLGALLLIRVIRAQRLGTPQAGRSVFAFSIIYLLALFAAVIAGQIV
jgi:heme O synthase-like polyprenyltransferase